MVQSRVEGKVVRRENQKDIYIGVFRLRGQWHVSSLVYSQPEEARKSLEFFHQPEEVLVVRVPLERRNGDGSRKKKSVSP
jgi:hypothetical protein